MTKPGIFHWVLAYKRMEAPIEKKYCKQAAKENLSKEQYEKFLEEIEGKMKR